MKCPICGGRKFTALNVCCDIEVYDKNDELVGGHTKAHMNRVEDDKYRCYKCDKEVDVIYESEE